ncbi:MAG: phosphoribosyltransferase family protein [Candidatus Beckwithbacteria bacterium]
MSLSVIKFPGENTQYLTPTWDEMNQLAYKIAKQILSCHKHFDRIVTLAKGGWPMTRSLVDFLSVSQVASLGIKFYSGINQRYQKPEIYQDFPVKMKGETVLLFDDVADTGHSFVFAKKHLKANGVKSITTAALFYKPHSIFQPDYFGFPTSAWIIFPYETIEAMRFLKKKWQAKGLTLAQIRVRLIKLNTPKAWANHFL